MSCCRARHRRSGSGPTSRQLIAERFGLDIRVVVRTRAQLAAVLKRNPFAKVAKNPKLYQVTSSRRRHLPRSCGSSRRPLSGKERVAHFERELYAWHPDGVGQSKLAGLISGKGLNVTATARNWTTVTRLLGIADEPSTG